MTAALNPRPGIVCLFVLLTLAVKNTSGNTCSAYNVRRERLDHFECPRKDDDWDERYCCGMSTRQKCCDYEDYLEENPDLSGGVMAMIIIFSILSILSILLVICCCCSCCYLAQRRQRRNQGLVLATSIPPTTGPNQTAAYPRQAYYEPVTQVLPPTNQAGYQYQYQPQQPDPVNPPPPTTQEYPKPPPYYEH